MCATYQEDTTNYLKVLPMETLDKMGLLLQELTNTAQELTGEEFNQGQYRCLMDDLHKLRGRLMVGCPYDKQGWQRVRGTVTVTVDQGN